MSVKIKVKRKEILEREEGITLEAEVYLSVRVVYFYNKVLNFRG